MANCHQLKVLDVRSNQLTSLVGLSDDLKLDDFYCEDNYLRSLDGLPRKSVGRLSYHKNLFTAEYNPEQHLKVIDFQAGLKIVKRMLWPYLIRGVVKFQRLWFRYWYGWVYDEKRQRYQICQEALVKHGDSWVARVTLRDFGENDGKSRLTGWI